MTDESVHTEQNSSDQPWLDSEIEFELAESSALSSLLESIAEALEESPESKRYDGQLVIEEVEE